MFQLWKYLKNVYTRKLSIFTTSFFLPLCLSSYSTLKPLVFCVSLYLSIYAIYIYIFPLCLFHFISFRIFLYMKIWCDQTTEIISYDDTPFELPINVRYQWAIYHSFCLSVSLTVYTFIWFLKCFRYIETVHLFYRLHWSI